MSSRPQRPQRPSAQQEATNSGMITALTGQPPPGASRRHSKGTSESQVHSIKTSSVDTQHWNVNIKHQRTHGISIATPKSHSRPLGPNIRARADSMPVQNKETSGMFADDLLRKISSRITKDPTARSHDPQYDENTHLRAPLTSRMSSKSHLDVDKYKQGESQKVGTLSLKLQESSIIEDLLFTMMGIEGKFISATRPIVTVQSQDADYVHMEFKVDESLDPSLRDLVSRILPLASIYLSLEAFVELHSMFEYGFVNHALCAAIRNLLKEYLILIAQLETQFRSSADFTLQKLWYYIQPTMQTLSSLDVLVGVIRDAGKKEPPNEDDVDIEALLNPRVGIPQERKGGSILAIIAGGMFNMSGDPVTKKLYGFLLNKASVPYISMLELWIHKGEILDPYEEFMIVESSKVKKESIKEDFSDAYWEQRYTIREKYVPPFLVPLKTKILLAGKYLNVIRECGIHLTNEQSSATEKQASNVSGHTERNDVLAALGGGNLVETIDAAYQYANKKLLDLLLKDKQLIGRLRSMKRYFFLDQSDYFTHFLDLASTELKRPWREVSLTKLQSLMDLVLRNPSSVTVNDVFKEDLKVDMSHLGLVDQLLRIISINGEEQGQSQGERRESRGSIRSKARTHSRASSGGAQNQLGSYDSWQDELAASAMEGVIATSTAQGKPLSGIDSLTLDYSVKFPLSLVISRKALTKYQLLFRHLLYLKHGEQVLCSTWIEHAKSPIWKNVSPELKQWRGRIYGLRSRMLTFVQQFAYYVCSEVLEPNWNNLASKLAKVSTVDQVLQIHSDFLDTCLNQCMLTNSKLLRIYSKLMSTCIKFTNYTDRFTRALTAMETQLDDEAAATAPSTQIQQIQQAIRRLSEFENGFTYHLKLLIDALNLYSATETVQFLCLVVRLDYNLFYANQSSESLNLASSAQLQ